MVISNFKNKRQNQTQIYLKTQEEVVAITMNKYRKAMQLLEEAERHHHDIEKTTSMSALPKAGNR